MSLQPRQKILLLVAFALQLLAIGNPGVVFWSFPLGLFLVLYASSLPWRRKDGELVRLNGGQVLTFAMASATGTYVTAMASAWIGQALGNSFHRGRQIRVRGRVVLPELEAKSSWSDRNATFAHDLRDVDPEARAALAQQWRENGKTEHASVAAFAKLSLELMALGAPPALLEAASRDGADEIRHARMCFALAAALDERSDGPCAFPAVSQESAPVDADAWMRLAVFSLFDGVVHEGLSARVLARLARRCEIPSIAMMLREIAADEGRHAAHAWDVVEYCVERGGPRVIEALHGALTAIPTRHESALPLEARDGSWERWGIHGHALERECYAATLDFVRARVAALGAGHVAAA